MLRNFLTGFYYAWLAFYTKWLLYLSPFALTLVICEAAMPTKEEEPHGMKIVRFCWMLVIVGWGTLFTALWRQREADLRVHWGIVADALGRRADGVEATRPSFKPLDPLADPYYYPSWRRMLQTIKLVPAIIIIFLVGWAVFGFVFWLELYLIFDWGGCTEMNARPGSDDTCDSASIKHGFVGTLAEMGPGLIEAIGFALLLLLNTLAAEKIVSMQNWRLQRDYDRSFAEIVFIMEFSGMFFWFYLVAFWFVPEFDFDEGWCTDWEGDDHTLALSRFVQNPMCAKDVAADRTLRYQMMRGYLVTPFVLSQLINVAVKTILPWAFHKRKARQRRKKAQQRDGGGGRAAAAPLAKPTTRRGACARCCASCCASAFDAVAFVYLCLVNQESGDFEEDQAISVTPGEGPLGPPATDDDEENAEAAGRAAKCSKYTSTRLKEILRESTLPEASVFDEYVEIVLQLAWVSSFSVIFPLGPLISLANNAVELRSDMLKMTRVQGRPIPRTATSIGPWVSIQHHVVKAGVFVNVGLYSLTLNDFDWMLGTGRIAQLIGAAVAVGCLLLAMSYVRMFVAPVSHWTKLRVRRQRKLKKQAFVAMLRERGTLNPALEQALEEFHIV